jgi:hypothetical protein
VLGASSNEGGGRVSLSKLPGYSDHAQRHRLTDRDIDVARIDVWREVYKAMIDYRETGEPQTFPDFEGSQVDYGVMWAYALSGQPDRAIEIFENTRIRPGAYGLAAMVDAQASSDLLGGDLRYQALLAEAGITW